MAPLHGVEGGTVHLEQRVDDQVGQAEGGMVALAVLGTAMQAMDAALAASTPAGASSQTRQRRGTAPSFAAAVRNTAGWGLP